jgi:hypothetical protein
MHGDADRGEQSHRGGDDTERKPDQAERGCVDAYDGASSWTRHDGYITQTPLTRRNPAAQ